jgi:RNA polymerase sigma factor (sigma-70 family)
MSFSRWIFAGDRWPDATSTGLIRRLNSPEKPVLDGALTEFSSAYGTLLLHICGRLLQLPQNDPRTVSIASDVLGKVNILFLERRGFRERRQRGSFRAWLRTVTENEVCDYLKREAREKNIPEIRGRLESLLDEHQDLFRHLWLGRVIARLKMEFEDRTVRAFEEHYLHAEPARDVAECLGMTANAVYLATNRVVTWLRRNGGDLCEDVLT